MNVFEYTAIRNPRGAAQMVQVYNLQPERNPRMLARQMAYCVERDGKYAKKLLAKIHPDKEIFEQQVADVKSEMEKAITEKQTKLEEMFHNMNGQNLKAEIEGLKNTDGTKRDKSELLMIGGLMLIGLALVLKQ